MSLDASLARVAQIEARLRALSTPIAPTALAPSHLPDGASGVSASAALSPTVRPFDVALAQASGQASIRPKAELLAPEVEAAIARHSAAHGVDPSLVRAVIRAESSGDPRAVSPKNAMGLMQLMPAVARGYGIRDPFNVDENVAGGVRHLASKLRAFNGDVRLALAAYNAGTGAVRRYGGIPPFTETQNYVRKVLGEIGGQ